MPYSCDLRDGLLIMSAAYSEILRLDPVKRELRSRLCVLRAVSCTLHASSHALCAHVSAAQIFVICSRGLHNGLRPSIATFCGSALRSNVLYAL
jgi:hypothetical protein